MLLTQSLPVLPAPEKFLRLRDCLAVTRAQSLFQFVRDDVVYHRCRCHPALLLAHDAQGVRTKEDKTLMVPLTAVDAGIFVHALVLLFGWTYDPHLTEQRLPLNLAVLGNEATPAVKHGGYHFGFIIISREDVQNLITIKKNCDAFTSRNYALSGIIVKYSQAHITSIKKATHRWPF